MGVNKLEYHLVQIPDQVLYCQVVLFFHHPRGRESRCTFSVEGNIPHARKRLPSGVAAASGPVTNVAQFIEPSLTFAPADESTVSRACADTVDPSAGDGMGGAQVFSDQVECEAPAVLPLCEPCSIPSELGAAALEEEDAPAPPVPVETGGEGDGEGSEFVPKDKESRLRWEANSTRHLLAHLPNNPFCEACQRA